MSNFLRNAGTRPRSIESRPADAVKDEKMASLLNTSTACPPPGRTARAMRYLATMHNNDCVKRRKLGMSCAHLHVHSCVLHAILHSLSCQHGTTGCRSHVVVAQSTKSPRDARCTTRTRAPTSTTSITITQAACIGVVLNQLRHVVLRIQSLRHR